MKKHFIVLILFFAVMMFFCGSVTAATSPLNTTESGNVSGDVYVGAYQPVPWNNQNSTATVKEFNQSYNIPTYTEIEWARLYAVVYGSSTDNREGRANVTFDGDGDGIYETSLGNETLSVTSSSNGECVWVNDHVNKVYTDYMMWYDVTSLISSNTINAKIDTEKVASNFDGRLKMLTLVVAYNDGDNDLVEYWINQGHWWQANSTTGQTTFNTTSIDPDWYSAQITDVMLSSKDAAYNFNGQNYTGTNPVSPYGNFGVNNWDVTNSVITENVSTLNYTTFAGSYKSTLAVLTVKYPALKVTDYYYNSGAGDVLFACEPNNIVVTILNNATEASGPFDVLLNINGYSATQSIVGLGASESVNVTFTGYKPDANGTVPLNVTVGSNLFSQSADIYYNGYKGKSYTNGSDIDTQATFEGNYNVIYSSGNTAYTGNKWTTKTYNWSASDLVIPTSATVVSARLYQPYTWNKMPINPAFTVSFNGNFVNTLATYADRKGFGTSNYPYGLYVYDVTSLFNTAGNTIILTPEGTPGTTNDYALYGGYLVVVYQDPQTTYKKIWINDEADLLQSRTDFSVNDIEATAYANFSDVDTEYLGSVTNINILASANEANKSKFFFNGNEYTGFSSGYLSGPQIGFSQYNVTNAILAGNNTAALQSYDNGTKGDFMMTMNSILVAEYPDLTVTNTRTGKGYDTISAAVAESLDGDTINVQSRVYTENVTVNKRLTLNAVGAVTVNPFDVISAVFKIDSSGSGSMIHGFTVNGSNNSAIYVDGASEVTLINNTINGTLGSDKSLYGICLVNSNGNNITNNVIIDCEEGINLYNVQNTIISGNTVKNNHWDNIALNLSLYNTIAQNTISNADSGIRLIGGSNNNTITQNNLTGNVWTSISLVSSLYNMIVDGNILSDNQAGTYLYESHNNTLRGNLVQNNIWDGIALHNSNYNNILDHTMISGNNDGVFIVGTSNHNIIIGNNFIANVWAGIALNGASENIIMQNNITGAHVGVYLSGSNENNIIQNNITSNDWDGIDVLNGSNQNVMTQNNISGSYYGERILDSTTNFSYQNNFISNTVHAYDNTATAGTNNWDNQVDTGNYYNDWTTTIPRPVDGGASIDNYPKITPF